MATAPEHVELAEFTDVGRPGWIPTMLGVGYWLCTNPWNLAGLPAISVPSAAAAGLPVGIQIVAASGGEPVIIAVAAELEQLRPWPQLAPAAAGDHQAIEA